MAHQRPMSTPIFDELLREFAIRVEEQREPAGPPATPAAEVPSPAPAQTPAQQAGSHRHRAEKNR